MAEDVVRIRVGMLVSYIAASKTERIVEVPRPEWDAMSEEERAAYLDGMAAEEASEYVEAWAFPAGDEEGDGGE